MKNTNYLLIIFFVLSPFYILSQENFSTSVLEPLQKNHLYREKVYIHINKTSYYPKEHIWFTTYVANDHNNTPSEYTTNLHVNLLNTSGEIIDHKTIFIDKGVGIGDFSIKKKYPPGKYYIQGFTNYMRNFGDKNTFIQEIELINSSIKNELDKNISDNHYDIQIFPESGYLLENVENTIGIKALINGKAKLFSGKIINSKGIKVSNIKSNFSGMSTCNFIYDKNESYTAIIYINNIRKKIAIPKAIKTGVIFNLDNSNTKNILLSIKTNKETLPTLKNDSFNLLFYRNNSIHEAIELDFSGTVLTEQEIRIEKTKMIHGVNIVTLFKNNQPIAERKFFINKPSEQSAFIIQELKNANDSIQFKIQTLNSEFIPTSAQLSVSILPKEALFFKETQNIKNAFLLSPYVKGTIENPSYYFRNTNPNEKEYLDLLLLNQGWIKYSLEELNKKINPKETFIFENGFSVNGKIKKYPKGYDIGFLSKKNRFVSFSKFNNTNEFLFKNIYAYKNETVKLSLIKKDKSLVKPRNLTLFQPDLKEKNYSFLTKKLKQISIKVENNEHTSDNNNYSNYNETPKLEKLDEILLNTVFTKKKMSPHQLQIEMASKRNIIGASFYKGAKVTREMEKNHRTVLSYLKKLGYVDSFETSIALRRIRLSFFTGTTNPDQTTPPAIYVDDTELAHPAPAREEAKVKRKYAKYNVIIQYLRGLSMLDVDEIFINKSGGGTGVSGGSIKIYLKKGNHRYLEEKDQKLYEELIMLTGFDRANNYYKPQYNIYSKKALNLTEIGWENNLKTNEDGEVFITVPKNDFSNEFQFIINGFSKNGLLFNTIYKTGSVNF